MAEVPRVAVAVAVARAPETEEAQRMVAPETVVVAVPKTVVVALVVRAAPPEAEAEAEDRSTLPSC